MRARLLRASLFAGLLAAAGAWPAGAEIYRWTDESGRTHFTSDLSQVPARFRAQAAQPIESKATFNEHEASAPPPTPRRDATPPAAAAPSTPASDAAEPERPRMADFEEPPPEPKPESPHKYIRDCSGPGRCDSRVNPEWKRWKAEQDARKAAEAAEE